MYVKVLQISALKPCSFESRVCQNRAFKEILEAYVLDIIDKIIPETFNLTLPNANANRNVRVN